MFLLEQGMGQGNICRGIDADDSQQEIGRNRIVQAEFMSQLEGAPSLSTLNTPCFQMWDCIYIGFLSGQATSELDMLVQDTKIAYLNGNITLEQMCARVHALCKVQRECISTMCKPARRGSSVAEAIRVHT
jgi:hypothetical protein